MPSSSKVPIWESAGAIVVSDKVGYCFQKRIRMVGGSAQRVAIPRRQSVSVAQSDAIRAMSRCSGRSTDGGFAE